uniref:Intercellular adhesion molecule 3 n=1 Tax=Sciurus vulgaris TaxID=55149 RepID=A0A8D2JPR3_SCIVU
MQPLHFCNLNCWLPSPPLCPAGHLLKAPSSLSLATMTPSSLLQGACRTLFIFQLLVCCLLPLGAQSQSQSHEFPLQVEPQNPVLPAGGSLLVNCSTRCPHPELITLETSLLKEALGEDRGWAAFRLLNVTGNSRIICSGFCNGSQMTSSSGITVYRFPERVELGLLPPWQPVGEDLTLQCHVWGGAPRAQLTLVLLRGEEELSRQPAVGEPAEVTATVLAGRGDYGANFTCRAELDLQLRGPGLFQNTSAPQQLRTFALPMVAPRLVAPLSVEVGTTWPVDCTLDGLFPASEAQVQLALGDQMLNPAVTIHRDTLRATATVTARADQEGEQQIVCNVTLGSESREARANLTVFTFLGPILNLSETNVTEGSKVNVTCTAGARVQVMLDGDLARAPGEPAQLQVTATEGDDGRYFFCNATLKVDGEVLHRNVTVQLRVLYGPKIDPAKCPQRLAWKDRTSHVLQCEARGNPAPQLQCLHEGSGREVPIGTPFLVKLHHNGTYHCQAVSPRGMYTLLVVMHVQDRKSHSISILIGVLVILGVVTVIASLIYIFGMQKRSGNYRVNQPSASVPLKPKQPEQTVELELSAAK